MFPCVFSGWPVTSYVSSEIRLKIFPQFLDLSFWVASDFATDDAGPDVAVFLDHGRSWLALSYLKVGGFSNVILGVDGSQLQSIFGYLMIADD